MKNVKQNSTWLQIMNQNTSKGNACQDNTLEMTSNKAQVLQRYSLV